MSKSGSLLAVVCLFLLAGCDSLVDCLDGDGPIFNKGTLNEGVLNEVYSDTVIASVDNEPRDDRFAYRFTLTGALPAGIQVRQTGRRLLFTGTATDSGDFPLTLFVTVDDGLSAFDSGLCYRSRTEDFVLRIREI